MDIDKPAGRSGPAASTARNAPAIVIAYAGSGADRLRSLLSAFPELACTRGTGIVPLCHQAVTAWQTVEDRAGPGMSPLAAASARALCGGLMTAILAREGGSRWCEFTNAQPAALRTFASVYPGTRFLVVHRRADAVARAVIGSGTWGLEGREFAPFVSAHPASPMAALASYWAVHTAQQLEFEQANPEACHRVRIEDLTGDPARVRPKIRDFLGLDATHAPPLFTDDDDGRDRQGDPNRASAAPALALDRIPGPLLAQIDDLHRSLGYPPLTSAGNKTG